MKAISLFTGIGGLDFGFEAAGFQTAVALEFDAKCAAVLRRNRSWPVVDQDIAEVPTGSLLETAGLAVGEADVLIGGPPCQPFSKSGFWVSGDARRLSDPRATTLESYFRVLAEARPRAFLLENVEGLGFRGKDEAIRLIRDRLEAINALHGTRYGASIQVLNAADFGVPQIRRRIFVVGHREGTEFEFPSPTHLPSELARSVGKERHRTSWDALHTITESKDDKLALSGKWADLLPSIPEGANYLWHTERGGGEPLFGWRRRYWSFLLKLSKGLPSWTIQAQPGPATGPFHWANRRLSAREMARIQTLPSGLVFGDSIADSQKQIGNAVPTLLAEILAREIATQLLGCSRRTDPLEHEIPEAPLAPPPEPPPAPVPAKYLPLRGPHEAHPGTGLGTRASARLVAAE